jgi:hypothetical protein
LLLTDDSEISISDERISEVLIWQFLFRKILRNNKNNFDGPSLIRI